MYEPVMCISLKNINGKQSVKVTYPSYKFGSRLLHTLNQVIFLLSMCQVRPILIYFSHSFSIFLNRTSTCFLPYSIISLTFQFPKFSKVIGPQISFFKLILFINLLYAFCCFSIILSFFGFQIDKFLLIFHSFIIFKIANHDKIKFVIQQTKCI